MRIVPGLPSVAGDDMRKVKKAVCASLNGGGYVYYNALLDLILVAAVLPLIILFHLQMANYLEDLDSGKMEWRLFAADLQSYLTDVESVHVINGGTGIWVLQQGEEFDIEVYGSVLRKQRFNLGHEIMLTNVSRCTFSIEGQVLDITLIRTDGTEERAEYAITGP